MNAITPSRNESCLFGNMINDKQSLYCPSCDVFPLRVSADGVRVCVGGAAYFVSSVRVALNAWHAIFFFPHMAHHTHPPFIYYNILNFSVCFGIKADQVRVLYYYYFCCLHACS